MKRVVVGFAGFIGSGKSSVTSIVAANINAVVLDVDLIAKKLMNSSVTIKNSLKKEFGVVHLNTIDYMKLGSVVFSDIEALKKLNSIVHPPLILHLNEKINKCRSNIILDAALLPMWSEEIYLDIAIWIDVLKEIRLKRLMERNCLSFEEASVRVDGQAKILQPPSRTKTKWQFWDNNGAMQDLAAKCSMLSEKIMCGYYA